MAIQGSIHACQSRRATCTSMLAGVRTSGEGGQAGRAPDIWPDDDTEGPANEGR